MKRINQYKKLFGFTGDLELKALKTAYRNLVKEWHLEKYKINEAEATKIEESGLL